MPVQGDRTRRGVQLLTIVASLVIALHGLGSVTMSVGDSGPVSLSQAGSNYAHVATWPLTSEAEVRAAPLDVALAPDGTTYVADANSNQVLVYDSAGGLIDRWYADIQRGCDRVFVPQALALDAQRDKLHVLWLVYRLGEAQPVTAVIQMRSSDGAVQSVASVSAFARDLAVDRQTGVLFVPYRANVWHVAESELLRVDGNRSAPGALAVLPNGWLVSVKIVGDVEISTQDGTSLGTLDLAGAKPIAVDTNADGEVFVLVADDAGQDSPLVRVYSGADGAFVRSIETAALQVPRVPNSGWPFSIAAQSDQVVVTTAGAQSFHVGRTKRSPIEGDVVRQGFDMPSSARAIRCEPPPLRLTRAGDGDLYAVNGEAGQVVRFDASGIPVHVGEIGENLIDAELRSDALYVITQAGALERRGFPEVGRIDWSVPCDCLPGGRVTAGLDRLYLAQPERRRIAVFRAADGVEQAAIESAGAGAWPYDVAGILDTRADVLAADLIGKTVQRWTSGATLTHQWPAGYVVGPRHVAVAGSGADELVGVSLLDGRVELYRGATGQLISRWSHDDELSRRHVSDIAVDHEGRVYLADEQFGEINVFAPGNGPLPTPDLSVPSPTPSNHTCEVSGDKVAAPSRAVLGSTVSVTLTLVADCPTMTRDVGADIVLVIDGSGSVSGGGDPAPLAEGLVSVIDLERHRVALVTMGAPRPAEDPLPAARLLVGLTSDRATLMRAIRSLPFTDSTLAPGLNLAGEHLAAAGRPGALPNVVLLTDGGHSGLQESSRAADRLRSGGIQLFAIGLTPEALAELLIELVGSPSRYFPVPTPDDLFLVYLRILHWTTTSLAGDLIVDDLIGPDMRLVEDSEMPEASVLDAGRHLRWGWTVLSASGVTMTYELEPTALGLLPTNERAVAHYTDIDGTGRQFVFPVPQVEVVAPTPTPPPSPVYLPLTLKQEIRAPSAIYLPLVSQDWCLPRNEHADVVLVLDTSTSMLDESRAGRTKMDLAIEAATHFVNLLEAGSQGAVVWFNDSAGVAQPLTGDTGLLEEALRTLETRQNTRIHLGIKAAAGELAGPRHLPGNRPVMVILTDGRANPVGPGAAVEEARTAKGAGITIFTVGLGQSEDLDDQALRDIASRSDYYYRTPNAADLLQIYETIAGVIPCR